MNREQAPGKAALALRTETIAMLAVIQQAELELRQLIEERAKLVNRIGSLKQTIVGLAKIFGDGILDAGLLELVDRKSPFQSCSLRALLGKLSLLTPKLAIEVGISEAISTASCRKRQNSLSER